jgi:hypothetical protein
MTASKGSTPVAPWLDGRVAGCVLAVIGTVLAALGMAASVVGAAITVQTFGASCGGWITTCMGQALLPVGLVAGAVGSVHLLAGRGAWSRRTWGRWLGLVVALGGLLFAVLAALRDLRAGEVAWPLAVPMIAYSASVISLWRWYPDQDGLHRASPSGPGA